MRRYRLTPEAARDLDEIIDFIAADHPAAADRIAAPVVASHSRDEMLAEADRR
jgi:plasmid stabilization system protein ParE